MTTGNVSDTAKPTHAEVRATGLSFGPRSLVMTLVDGRQTAIPLHFYPTLQKASRSQRDAWELIGSGRAFHWEELDLDISVEGLLHGLPERVPSPPERK